ncbi:MAG: nuclear transport factor 2 family protein [Deltaproteobacteria bacterium]|nr:nuclear transport factor 2 family protein [Deltaproteobacteria bacterium]
MSSADIERRLQALEDIEAIKKLKIRYCHCADTQDYVTFPTLFTEDAVWDGKPFGYAEGPKAIEEFLRKAQSSALPFALHYVMNASVEVTGSTAVGTWYLLEPCTMTMNDGRQSQAVWGTATYENHFRKEHGEWKFTRVHLKPVFWTPFDQGWVKKRFVQE